MTDPRPITIRTVGLCQECGAVVHDEAKHFEWHVDQLPDDPAPTPDRWEEILATRMHGSNWSWDECLRAAMRHLADAIHHQDKMHPDDYRPHLVEAAARVRAMAPEGTQWKDPKDPSLGFPTHSRSALRTVLRELIDADGRRGRDAPYVDMLVSADAYLHGLWLTAREEK